MKTTNHYSPENDNTDMLVLFASSRLNHTEMLTIRGGEDKVKDDGGSTQDRQEDGFN